MNYGLLEELVETTAYILGRLKTPYIEYLDDGNWEPYLPIFERQRTDHNEETSACTVFGSLTQLETFERYLYGIEPNYSERFNYVNVGINPDVGTDPQKVYESIRKDGVIDQKLLPMTDTLEAFTDPSAVTPSMRAKGQYWVSRYEYMHEWVWTTKPENHIDVLREALKTSPIAVSVSAWNKVGDEYVSNQGSVNNHFCLCYKVDADGYPWVYDTYDNAKKKLSKDHNIRRAKRIWINKRTNVGLTQHRNILVALLNYLMNKKDLLAVCEASIGFDASPNDEAPDELGCANTVTALLKKIYPETPSIVSTYKLWQYLKNPKNGWESVPVPVPGCVIVSPTGLGKPGAIGHTGFILANNVIASNDSKTGKFMKNYTMETWTRYYQHRLQFPIYMYKHT